MQIQKLQPSDFSSFHETSRHHRVLSHLSQALSLRDKPVEFQPLVVNKEMIERFSEWYLRMGKTYEATKSYRQAISAYEKSYAVDPAYGKAASIESIRGKILEK
ncbi:hypothetical protein [Thermospira aquatica]|uniref:Tetratricopeptide repeat protein n=1 Tax=Thermospira aquatica TaxID=2828656 RepID=A0AAX3BCF8_9SPIR|nr:hypothetical protein [Thermospira aquatica]URA09950.1 hypothetical protein KDW03_10785 [Thermospira aquatica]